MKRMFLVLTMTAMLLAMLLTVPAGGQDFGPDGGTKGREDEPQPPECDWYGPYTRWQGREYDPWWEYWCWWPGWGWEYVFWVWA